MKKRQLQHPTASHQLLPWHNGSCIENSGTVRLKRRLRLLFAYDSRFNPPVCLSITSAADGFQVSHCQDVHLAALALGWRLLQDSQGQRREAPSINSEQCQCALRRQQLSQSRTSVCGPLVRRCDLSGDFLLGYSFPVQSAVLVHSISTMAVTLLAWWVASTKLSRTKTVAEARQKKKKTVPDHLRGKETSSKQEDQSLVVQVDS